MATTAPARPRRSALYLPGSNARAIEKARTLPCDVVILDLEDSVAPEAKVAARALACEAVRVGGFGDRELVIRVNGLDTAWGAEDLAAAADAGPDAVLAPTVSAPPATTCRRPCPRPAFRASSPATAGAFARRAGRRRWTPAPRRRWCSTPPTRRPWRSCPWAC